MIQDQFTRLKISRQRKWQLRRRQEKKCTICRQPAEWGARCLKCTVVARERQRKRAGSKRRYNSISYQFEKKFRLTRKVKNGK